MARYRFQIVADPGDAAVTLNVECATDGLAIEAAVMFAEDAVEVCVTRERVLLWRSDARSPDAVH